MNDPQARSVLEIAADEALEAGLDAESEADVAASRIVPNRTVREWLVKLARGERLPPPLA